MDIFFWRNMAAQTDGRLCLPVGDLNPVQIFESITDSQYVFTAGRIVFEQIDKRADRLVWCQTKKSDQSLFKNCDLLLWKNLLELPDSGIKGVIGEKTHACITISEKDTERLDDTKYWCTEVTDDLVEYAKLYVKLRDRIDDPKKSDLCRDRKFYIELFDQIKDLPSCNKYIDAYSDVFPCPEGINRCVTVSGLPKGEYDVIKSAKLKIDLGTTDRNLLDTCILLYQALKKERNTTNHANENTNEHLDPNHTRTAIKVLTKLCRKLT